MALKECWLLPHCARTSVGQPYAPSVVQGAGMKGRGGGTHRATPKGERACVCWRVSVTTLSIGLWPRPNTPGTHPAKEAFVPLRLKHLRFLAETPGGFAARRLTALVAGELADYALGLWPQPHTARGPSGPKAICTLLLSQLRGHIAFLWHTCSC